MKHLPHMTRLIITQYGFAANKIIVKTNYYSHHYGVKMVDHLLMQDQIDPKINPQDRQAWLYIL